jgi:hypothetical protein
MASTPIDVWNVASFDEALLAKLREEEGLVRDYLTTSQRLFEEQNAARGRVLTETNTYAEDFQGFVEDIGLAMNSRIIRAWHYTRLEDDELETVHKEGFHPSTLVSLRKRLDARAKAGAFSAAVADALYAESRMHHESQRSGKFYMASEPTPIDDLGVVRLLRNWGGEVTYFGLLDEGLKQVVARIGKARVLEIAVPVSSTNNWHHAGKAVVCGFARSLGLYADGRNFDVSAHVSLVRTALLRVHTEGEKDFLAIGRGYPEEFAFDDQE